MKNKTVIFITAIALIAPTIIFIFMIISLLYKPKNMTAAVPRITHEKPIPGPIYDINKVKNTARSGGPAKDSSLSQVYQNYPSEDVGKNMAEGWARVKPEEKKRLMDDLDKKIGESKRTLEAEPENKRAKHILFISKTLRKLAADGFNYDLEQPPDRENRRRIV